MAKRKSRKGTKPSIAGHAPAVQPAANGETSVVTRSASQLVAVPVSVTHERLTPAVEAPAPNIAPERLETPTISEAAVTNTPAVGVQVTFLLYEPDGKEIWLCGDFNGWASGRIPMKRQPGGKWTATVALVPGRYEYKFTVDGHWIPDPLARENVWNHHGTLNSVIEVRG